MTRAEEYDSFEFPLQRGSKSFHAFLAWWNPLYRLEGNAGEMLRIILPGMCSRCKSPLVNVYRMHGDELDEYDLIGGSILCEDCHRKDREREIREERQMIMYSSWLSAKIRDEARLSREISSLSEIIDKNSDLIIYDVNNINYE